jgi:protein TonB
MPNEDDVRKKQTGTQDLKGSDQTAISGLDGVEGQGDDAVYTFVDQAAEFPGGPVILARFVSKHMVYPKPARRAGIEGVVHVGFIVGKGGVISDVEIVKGLSPECDAEAIRVVKLMPPWRPAIQGGVAVRSRFVLPLRFKLGLVQNQ